MKKSLYDLLGVPNNASFQQIESAYQLASQDIAAQVNPDPNASVILREAFHVLSNPQRRASYDATLTARVAQKIEQADSLFDSAADTHASIRRIKLWSRIIFSMLLIMVIWFVWHSQQNPAKAKPTHFSAPVRVLTPPPSPKAEPQNDSMSAERIYAERSPSIALIHALGPNDTPTSLGSGVVIAPNTLITNCHVVRNATSLQAKIGNEQLTPTLEIMDEEFDLCRLSVASSAPAAPIGATDTLRIGQKVFAIGAPQGLDLTISEGIISSLRSTPAGNVIQTTAPASPGSSGGGLFDESGKLIGIVTFQVKTGQNLNFAVPADWIGQMKARSGSGELLPR